MLRFKVGSRVACNLGDEWATGTVTKLHYREDDWPRGKVVPYQVRLDSKWEGSLIFAPVDAPRVIRDATAAPAPTLSVPANGDAEAALKLLASEVPSVRALAFVVEASDPHPFGIAESNGDLIVPSSGTGPWVVSMKLRPPEGTAYSSVYKVNVKINAAWPSSPPEARFCGSIHHDAILEDQGGLVPADVLQDLLSQHTHTSAGKGTHNLCAVARALMELLSPQDSNWLSQTSRMNSERLRVIAAYQSQWCHPQLFDVQKGWLEEWFDPDFLKVARLPAEEQEAGWRGLVREEAWEVYSLPVFKLGFCEMFVQEMDNFNRSGLPARRPNSMNNYGLIVNHIGMEPMMDRLQMDFLLPISRALFPGIGSHFDEHHSFIVRYKMGEDLGLDVHTDDSDVTFNICLGRDFKGAGLQFCGNQGSAQHRRASLCYQHVKGRCVVHKGHRRHGADDLTEGERLNLIVWNRNSEYRKSREFSRYHMQSRETGYETEVGPPDPMCLSFTHDRDYGVFKSYSAKTRGHEGQGWCPPRHAEYAGFVTESSRARP